MKPAVVSTAVLLIIAVGWSYLLLRRFREWRAGVLIASLATSAALLSMALWSLVTTGSAGISLGPMQLQQLATGCLLLAAAIHLNAAIHNDALTGLPSREIGRAHV